MPPPFITAKQALGNNMKFSDFGNTGNIPGQTKGLGSDSSSQKFLNSTGTFSGGSGSVLTYPDNIGSEDQAHFVIFSIRKFTPSKIDVKRKERAEAARVASTITAGAGDINAAITGSNKALTPQNDHISAVGGSIRLKEAAKVKIDTRIALYMPPSVSANYSVNYSDESIGLVAEAGWAAFNAFMRTCLLYTSDAADE